MGRCFVECMVGIGEDVGCYSSLACDGRFHQYDVEMGQFWSWNGGNVVVAIVVGVRGILFVVVVERYLGLWNCGLYRVGFENPDTCCLND